MKSDLSEAENGVDQVSTEMFFFNQQSDITK